MTIAFPARDQVDVQVRYPLPAGGAVVLTNREPIRSKAVSKQPRHRTDGQHQGESGGVVEVPDALDVRTRNDECARATPG